MAYEKIITVGDAMYELDRCVRVLENIRSTGFEWSDADYVIERSRRLLAAWNEREKE